MTDVDRVVPNIGTTSGTTHRYEFDWESTSATVGVVEAVADATDREPLSLPQLGKNIDSDALDSLFRSRDEGVTISFYFAGCEVTVESGGEVTVQLVESGL